MINLIQHDELTSTNEWLEMMLSKGVDFPEWTVVSTDYQSKGKGQIGNIWCSNKGENLLFSLLLHPSFMEIKRYFYISMVTSLAIRNALTQFVSDITIKWPNDIYYRNQKITGILIENSLLGSTISASIIGVGQNVNQTEFPEWIPNPVSLKQILNKEVDRNSVLNAILVQTENMYNRLQNGDFENIRKDYLQSLYHRDGYYKYESKGEVFEARIITVEDNGELVLLDKNGDERRFMFKEVSFVIEA